MGLRTTDPLEEVLTLGYFAAARGLLRAGELVYVSTCPEGKPGSGTEPGAPRMALVMFQADARDTARAGASVRLVQDFGGAHGAAGTLDPTAATAPEAPVKRGRGRPPGSRTKKPAALAPAG